MDPSLQILLDNYSIQTGLTKAKLINEWLEELDSKPIKVFDTEYNSKKSISFNLYLKSSDYERINLLAKDQGLHQSRFLRNLIQQKILESADSAKNLRNELIQNLYSIGDLDILRIKLENHFENLNFKNYSILIEVYIKQGRIKQAESVINHVKLNLIDPKSKLEIVLFETYILIIKRNLNEAYKILNSILTENRKSPYRKILGKCYYQIGIINFVNRNYKQALIDYLNALEVLDIVNHRELIIEIYLDLTRLYHILNNPLAETLLEKITNHLNNQPNYILKSWLLQLNSAKSFISNDLISAAKYNNSILQTAEKLNSNRLKYTSYQELAFISLLKNDDSTANLFLSKFNNLKTILMIDYTVNLGSLLSYFNESSQNFNKINTILENLNNKNPENGLVSYFYGAVKFLKSGNEKIKNEGENMLTRLVAKNKDKNIISNAAHHTLLSRRLYPVR